ncbi:MAG: POTRA domain-containing protein, partial [Bryobacteraceae bacterium]
MPYLLLVVLASLGQVSSAQSTQTPLIQEALKYEGARISSIQFDPEDQPLTAADLGQILPFQSGSTFHERDLQLAIQRLYSTGRFADLAVDASSPGPGRVALRFVTKRAYFVGRVVVGGVKEPPNGGQLASATKLRLGMPYSESERVQAIESLTDLLRQNGLYDATVRANVEYDEPIESANLTFTIVPGKRARFEEPVITGELARPADVLVRATRWKRLYGLLGWQPVTDERVRQGLDNIRHLYQKDNRLRATVALTSLTFETETDTVKPALSVNAGPVILVQTKGMKIDRGKLKQLVPVFQEGSVDTDLLVEGQRNIENYLEGEGYFGAKVTYSSRESTTSREQAVTYQIERGPKHKFVHLAISGYRYFTSGAIRERLYMQPAEFPRYPYGRYSANYLRQDIQSIENLYTSNGFRDVKVTSRIVDNYHGRKNQIAVFIDIKEGPQWFVSQLNIEGTSA